MATQNTKTKTTLADKDKKVLMILGALVILVLAWFLGYQKFNEQRETVVTENDQLAMEVSQLRAKVSKKAQVEADTEKKNARTEQVLLAYPSELRTQDAINRFDQLEKKVKGLTIDNGELYNESDLLPGWRSIRRGCSTECRQRCSVERCEWWQFDS